MPCGGRYQTRTDDLFRVKEARYQLRQTPVRPVCHITSFQVAVWRLVSPTNLGIVEESRKGRADVAQW